VDPAPGPLDFLGPGKGGRGPDAPSENARKATGKRGGGLLTCVRKGKPNIDSRGYQPGRPRNIRPRSQRTLRGIAPQTGTGPKEAKVQRLVGDAGRTAKKRRSPLTAERGKAAVPKTVPHVVPQEKVKLAPPRGGALVTGEKGKDDTQNCRVA